MNKHSFISFTTRKIYIGSTLFFLILLTSCCQNTKQVPTPDKLQTSSFKMSEVKLTNSPFKHAETKAAEYLLLLDIDRLLSGFRSEAGLEPKANKYGGWESRGVAGHSLGHYLSACSMYYATYNDDRFLRRITYIIDELEVCQNANNNGYVAATPNGKKLFGEVANGDIRSQGFDLNGGWVPLYVMHKVLAGLIDAYQYTENQKALRVASRLADWMCTTFLELNDSEMQRVMTCEFGGMNEALANLYSFTQNENHLKLARVFDNHKEVMDSLAICKDNLEGKHANTQIPKIVGAARLFELTGSKRDSLIATFFWNTVINNHTYINGGNSDWEHFGTPGKLNDRLDLNTTETCNTYNMLKLTHHLFSWCARSEYSNYYERAVYNHILASQNPEDGMCVYFTPLVAGGQKSYLTPFDSFACCTGSGMENHMKYGDFIYSKGQDGSLLINLFIPSRLSWNKKGISIIQETQLPNSNSVKLSLETDSSQTFAIRIRYPQWTKKMEVKVNGQNMEVSPDKNGYVSILKKWKDRDEVEILFDMQLYTIAMPDNPKRIGIFYGPVLLAGELGSEDINIATEIPVLVTDDTSPNRWLMKISENPLRFKTKNIGRPNDIVLRPFYEMHHQHYIVYWDLFNNNEWQKEQDIKD